MARFINRFKSSALRWQLEKGSQFVREGFVDIDTLNKHSFEFSHLLRGVEMQIGALRELLESRDAMREVQNCRLRAIVARANESDWWHAFFERSVVDPGQIQNTDDLLRLPPIDRTTLMDIPKRDFYTSSVSPGSILWGRTSGSTTGTPFMWGMLKKIWRVNMLAHHMLDLSESGFNYSQRAHDDFCLLFNYSGTPGHMQHYLMGNARVAHDDEYVDNHIRALAGLMETHGPVIIRSTPLELLFLTQKMQELGLQPPVHACSVTGARLDTDVSEFIASNLGCEIRPIFGTQELGGIGLGCRENPELFHIWSERIYPEIVNGEGLRMRDGDFGKVTLTCLDNALMPLLRYQTGDDGRMVTNYHCSCRYRGEYTLELAERMNESVICKDLSVISIRIVASYFKKEPFTSNVRRFQIHQKVPGAIDIYLEVRTELPANLLMRIKDAMRKAHKLEISISQVSSIPQDSAKFKIFIQSVTPEPASQ